MTSRRNLLLAAPSLLAAQSAKPPVLKVSLPGGKSLLTSQLAGPGPFAVSIFKTSCPHCQKSLPIIEKVTKEFSSRGFRALGVAVDQNPEPLVQQFARQYGISFPLGWAPIEDICQFLDTKPESLYVPALAVFQRNGKLHARYPAGDAFFNFEENNLRNLAELLTKATTKKS